MVDTNVQSVRSESREIPLSRGFVAVVDAEDYERLAVFKWSALVNRGSLTVYAVRHEGGRSILMHRFILGLQGGPEVDHVDRDGLNNRRGNLRLATHATNMLNRRRQKNNTSGFRGVTWDKQTCRWMAYTTKDRRYITFGRFDDLVEAALARDAGVLAVHGQFAQLNFPKENNA